MAFFSCTVTVSALHARSGKMEKHAFYINNLDNKTEARICPNFENELFGIFMTQVFTCV